MTKPLPTDCIKDDEDIHWETLNILLEKVDFKNEIAHLFVVDIFFDEKKATKQQLVYNEIYPPITEKKKVIDPCERSVFQLLEQHKERENANPLFYCSTHKAHATTFKKNLHQCI